MAIGFFQQRIEKIINDVLSANDATQLTAEQLTQLSSQLALYFSTILLTLGALLFIVLLAIWLFRRAPRTATGEDKELARQHLLQDLENQLLALQTAPGLWLTNHPTFDAKTVYECSLALSQEITWQTQTPVETAWNMGDRLIVLNEQGDQLTAQWLEQMLFWFRRLDRAASAELVKIEDISLLWRHILPFVLDNRFSFIASYLAATDKTEQEEIEALRRVTLETIRYCQQQKRSYPLSFIKGRLDPLFLETLPKGMRASLQTAKAVKPVFSKQHTAMVTSEEKRVEPVIQTGEQRKEPTLTNSDKTAAVASKNVRKEPVVTLSDIDIDTKRSE